jgi:hypothetical protein
MHHELRVFMTEAHAYKVKKDGRVAKVGELVDLYRRNWFSISVRDVMVVACCLVWEHTSLKAFWFLARNWKRVMVKSAICIASRRPSRSFRCPGLAGAACR